MSGTWASGFSGLDGFAKKLRSAADTLTNTTKAVAELTASGASNVTNGIQDLAASGKAAKLGAGAVVEQLRY